MRGSAAMGVGGAVRLAAALLVLAAWAAAEDGPPEDDYRGPPPSEHEHPRDVPTRPQNYRAPGHWATPPPEAGIQLGFVPQRLYAQVRHSDTVRHLPRSAALAEARTAEEVAAAPRLREVLKSKKVSEVYSEEGYEDSAYDHAGHEKNSEQEEDYERHEDARKKPAPRRRRPHQHDQHEEGSERVEAARLPPGDADLDAAAAAAIAAPVVRHSVLHKASLVMSVEDSDSGRRPNKLVAGYTHLITHPSHRPAPFAPRVADDRVSVATSSVPPVSQPRKAEHRRTLEPIRLPISRRQDAASGNATPRTSQGNEKEQSNPTDVTGPLDSSTPRPAEDKDASSEPEASKWEPARKSPLRASKIPIAIKDTKPEARLEPEERNRNQRRRRPSSSVQDKNVEVKTELTATPATQTPVLTSSKLKPIHVQSKVTSDKASQQNQVTNRPSNFRLVIEDRFSEEMTPSEFSKFLADAIGTKRETSSSSPEQTKKRLARNHAPEYRPITEPLTTVFRSRRDTAQETTAASALSETTEALETVLQPTSWRVYGPRESDTIVVQQVSGDGNVPQLLGESGTSADSVANPSAWAFPDLAPAKDSTEGFSQQVLPQNFFNQPYWYPRPFTLPVSQVAESRVDLHIAEPEQAVVADDQDQEAQQLEETKVLQPVTWPSLDDADEILIFIKTKSRPSNDTGKNKVARTVPTSQLQMNKTVNSSSLETLETVSSSYVVQNPIFPLQQSRWPMENITETNDTPKSSLYLRGEDRENSSYHETTDSVMITDPTPELRSNTTDDSRSFENVHSNSSSDYAEEQVHYSKHSRPTYSKTESPDELKQSSVRTTMVTTTTSDSLGANDTEASLITTVSSQTEISSNTQSDLYATLPTVNPNYDKEPITTKTQSDDLGTNTDADHLLEALQLDSSSFGVRKSAPRSRYPNVPVEKVTVQTVKHEKYAVQTTTDTIPQAYNNHNDTEDDITTEHVSEERANETDSDLSVETLHTDSTSYRRWQPTPYAKHPSLPLESSLQLSAEQEPVAMETVPRPDTRPSDEHSKETADGTTDGSATKSQVRGRGRGTRLRISSRYTAANLTTTTAAVPHVGTDDPDVTELPVTEAGLRKSLQVIPLTRGRIPQYDVLEQDTTADVLNTTGGTVSTTPEASDVTHMPVTVSGKEVLNVKETANFGEYFSSRGFWGPIQHLVQETAPVVKYLYPKIDATLPASTTSDTSSVEAVPTTTEIASSPDNKSQTADVLTESLGKPRIITASTLQYHQVPTVENTTTRILIKSAYENSPQQADFTAQLTSAQFSLPPDRSTGSHNQSQTLNATEFPSVADPDPTMAGNISEGLSETQASGERYVSGKDGRYHKVIGRRPASSSFVAGDAVASASSVWASYLESPLHPQAFNDADESETRAGEEGEEEPSQEAQDREDYVDDTEGDVNERNSELEEDSAPGSPATERNDNNREKRRYLESEEEEQRLEEEEKKLDAEKDREVEEEKKEWVEALREIDHPKIRAPFNNVKYPFYYGVPRGTLSAYSPIRYALNPHAVPQKTAGGMEFYDSREELVECPEVSPNLKNVVPKRRRPGEWNKSPMPKNLPRLRGLGDKIDCLKVKYWGAEPLDSPFFKEEEIGKQVGASSSQVESLRDDDSTGFYSEILGNIRNIQALGNMKFSLHGSDSSSSPSIDAVKYQNRVPPNTPPAKQKDTPRAEIVTADGRNPPVPAENLTPPNPVLVGGKHRNPQGPAVVSNTDEKPQPLPARILYAQQKNVPPNFPDTSNVRPGLQPQKSPNLGPVMFLPAQFQGYSATVPQLGYVGISPRPLPPTQTPAQTQLLVEQLLAQVPSRARSEEVIGLKPPPLPAATPFVASQTLPRIIAASPQRGLLLAAAPFEDSMASDSRPMGEKDPMEASASDSVAAVVSVNGESVPVQESSQSETEWVDQQAISSQLVEQSRRVVYHEQTAMSPVEDDQGQAAPRSSRRKESRAHRTTMETSQKMYRHYGDGGEGQEGPRRGRGHRRRQRVRPREYEASESAGDVERPRNRRLKGHREGRRNNLIQNPAEPRGKEYAESINPVEGEGYRAGRRNNVIQSSGEPRRNEDTEASIPVEAPESHRGSRRNGLIQSSAEPRGKEYTETTAQVEALEGHRAGRRNNVIQSSVEPRRKEYTESAIPVEVPDIHRGGRRNNLIQSSAEPRGTESTEASIPVEDSTAVNQRGRAPQRRPTSWSYDKRRGEPRYEDAKADIYSKNLVVEAERRNSNSSGIVSGHVPALDNESQKVPISTDETASSEAPLATFHVAYNTGSNWGKQENRRGKNRDDTVVDRDATSAARVKDDSRENDINTVYRSGTARRISGNVPTTNTVEKLKDLGLWLSPSQINNVISSFISSHKTLLESTSELPDQTNYITENSIESTTAEPQKLTSPRRNTDRHLVTTPRAITEDIPQVTTEYVKPMRTSSGRKSSVAPEVVVSTATTPEIPQTTTEFVKSVRLTSVRKSNVVPELVTSTVTPPEHYSTKRRKRPKYKKLLPFSVTENTKVEPIRETVPVANHAGQRYHSTTNSAQDTLERSQVVSESYPTVTPVRQRNRLPTNMLKRKYETLSNDNTHETTTETISGAKDRLQVTRWQKQESMKVNGNQEFSTEGTVERKENLPETRANRGNSVRANEKIGSGARRYQYALHGNDASQSVSSTKPTVWTGDKQITEAVPTEKVVRNKYRQHTDQPRRQNEYETADSARKDRPLQRLVQASATQTAEGQRSQFPASVVGETPADGEAAPKRVQWRPRPHWHRLPAPRNQPRVPEEPATEATHQTRGQRGRPRLANDLQRRTYDPTSKTHGVTTVAPPSTTEPSRRIKAVEHRRVTKEEIFTRTYIPDDNLADELVEQSERDIVIEPYRGHVEEEEEEEEEDIFEPFESLHFERDYVMYPDNHLSENDDVESGDDYDEEYDAYDEYDEEDTANTHLGNSGMKDTPGTSDTSNDRETSISVTRGEVSKEKENTEPSTITPSSQHTLTTQRPREFTRRVDKVLDSETESDEFSSRDAVGLTKSVQGTGKSKSESDRLYIRHQMSGQGVKETDTAREEKGPSGVRYTTRASTSNAQTTTEQTTATTASVEKSREKSTTSVKRLNQRRYPSRRFPVNESATNAPDKRKKVIYHAVNGDEQRREDFGYETSTNTAEDYKEAVEDVTTTEAPRRQVYTPTIPPYRQPTTRRSERRQGTGGSMISYTVDTETGVGLWLPEGAERIMERRPKASRLPWKERPKKIDNKELSGDKIREDGIGSEIRNRLRSNLHKQNGAKDATDGQTEEMKGSGSEESKRRTDVKGERGDRAGLSRKQRPATDVGSVSTVEDASDENSTLPEGLRGKPNGDQLYKAYMASLHDGSGTSDVTDSPLTAEEEDILSEHQVYILGKILSALPPRQRAGIVRGMVTGLNGDPLHTVFEKDRVRRSHQHAEEGEGTPVEPTASRTTERREGT